MNTQLNKNKINTFQTTIYAYYNEHKRDFAWRNTTNPYHIIVSEIMLQQTQTYRVAPKYELFIQKFPNFATLATAPLKELLLAWQGLGYNRRALSLQKTAQIIMQEYNGTLPQDPEILKTFPGIGPATAASICAFAFNAPTTFIETNIRSVYIHFFFHNQSNINDKQLLPLIEQTVDTKNSREWYYALMDYGVMLKKNITNPSRKSAHHTQQSKFEGSDRQIRGMILRLLTQHHRLSYNQIIENTQKEPQRVQKILKQLHAETFIIKNNELFEISS